ncbi:MAG TPA: protein kinase [Gemmataceae bacterium]|nr:protein kinase [Gemmataceae bacterium]
MAEKQSVAQLIEVLRRDQRRCWQAGKKVTAEAYLRQHPELLPDAEGTLELIYNELVVRQALGEAPQLQEYQERFPQLSERLELLFEVHSALEECPLSAPSSVDSMTDLTTPASGAISSFPLVPGLEILRELGRGGMSVVFEARQKNLNRRVALKMLLAGNYAGAEQRSRFHTEAEALGHLQHPHIVPVYEVGEHEGRPFLIMEFVEGGTLTQHLTRGPLPARQSAGLVQQLARAIHYAHQRGIVHRDLKPANILLERAEGETASRNDKKLTHSHVDCFPVSLHPKITDFGLAKFLAGDSATPSTAEPTQSGTILGTASYMSPEQAAGRNRDITPATDIYALGAILYELLTGRPPFQGATPREIMVDVQTIEPLSPSQLCPHLSRDLVTISLKCLQKEPWKRYATAEALADDLGRFLAGEPIQARPVGALERTWRWSRRNPRRAAAFATVAGLLVVIAAGTTLWSLERGVALERARQAEADAARKLFDSRLSEARALSLSRRPGQRFQSLAILGEAIEQARGLKLPATHIHDLRNATLASLAMPDLYPVLTAARSPNGTCSFDDELAIYARCDASGNCSIRRVDTDEELYPPLANAGISPRLSPDGRFLAVFRPGGKATVWRLNSNAEERLLSAENVGMISFHPRNQQIAFSHADGAISLFDLTDGKQLKRLAPGGPTREVVIALHPREPLVAVGSYHGRVAQIRNLQTGALERSISLPGGCSDLAWHPLGRWLAVSDGNGPNIHVFDGTTFQHLRQFGPVDGGARLFFNHVGDRLAAYDWSWSVQLFDFAAGQLLFQLPSTKMVASLQFRRDDRLMAGFIDDGRIGFWQVADGAEYRLFAGRPSGKKNSYHSPTVSPDGRLLSLATADGVTIWDFQKGTELAYLQLDEPTFVHFEPHGGLLIGDYTGTYRWPLVYDTGAAGLLRIGPPQPLALPPGGYITQSGDGRVLAVPNRTTGGYAPFAGAWVLHPDRPGAPWNLDPGADIGFIALSPNGKWTVTTDFARGHVKVWDTRTGRLERSLLQRGGGPVQFSPDGQWLAVMGSPSRLFSLPAWEAKHEFNGSVRFAPDSRTLAVSTGTHAFSLVEVFSGQELARLEDPNLHLTTDFLFSPDGSSIVTVDKNKGAHVWDLRALRRQLAEHDLDWDAPPYPPAATAGKPLQIQFEMGDYRQMSQRVLAENYDRTVTAAPQLPGRWYYRSLFHRMAGRDEQAVKDLQKAVELSPNFAAACNALAWLYATGPEKLRDPVQAVALAERVVKLVPEHWVYWNTLGVAYYRAGRFQDAARALEAGLKGGAGESDAFDLYFLALCHHRLGDAAKARAALDQARIWHEQNGSRLSREEKDELQRFRGEAEEALGSAQN